MKLAKENLGKVSVTVEKAYHSVDKEYDKLVVVEEEGQFRTFISRKPVPIGIELTDREFWLPFSSVKESIVIDYNKFKQYIRTGEGLLDDSIVTRHIKDRNVTGDKIAEATITFVNIANEAVTLPKINKEAIDTTLTKEGHLAEAKHTGDRLLNIEGLSVIKVPSTQSTVLDAWQIVDKKGNVHGVTINTYKDKSIDAIWLSIHEDDTKPENPEVKVDNPRYLNIVYNKADGTQQKVSIPLASFVTEAEFSKNGFKVINGVVNLKISSDITTSRYFHFDADGNITLDGFEERILEDLGTLEHSQPGDGTMWGEFKKQEEIREQVSNSAHQVFSDNWDEQDDDPEDYDPLAVTEASYAYNWKTTDTPASDGKTEGNLKDLYQSTVDLNEKVIELEGENHQISADIIEFKYKSDIDGEVPFAFKKGITYILRNIGTNVVKCSTRLRKDGEAIDSNIDLYPNSNKTFIPTADANWLRHGAAISIIIKTDNNIESRISSIENQTENNKRDIDKNKDYHFSDILNLEYNCGDEGGLYPYHFEVGKTYIIKMLSSTTRMFSTRATKNGDTEESFQVYSNTLKYFTPTKNAEWLRIGGAAIGNIKILETETERAITNTDSVAMNSTMKYIDKVEGPGEQYRYDFIAGRTYIITCLNSAGYQLNTVKDNEEIIEPIYGNGYISKTGSYEFTPTKKAEYLRIGTTPSFTQVTIIEKSHLAEALQNVTFHKMEVFEPEYELRDVTNLLNGISMSTTDFMFNVLDKFYTLMTQNSSYVSRVDAAQSVSLSYPIYANLNGQASGDYDATPSYKTYMYKFIDMNNCNGPFTRKKKLLIIGGNHGNERAAIVNTYLFAKGLCDATNITYFKLRSMYDIYIIPILNGYGTYHSTRVNANGVNINRNFPIEKWKADGNPGDNNYTGASAGSEFETQLVMKITDDVKPDIAIDHHNYTHDTYNKQFYVEVCKHQLLPLMYQSLTECSFALIKGLPNYFGNGFKLFRNSSYDAPAQIADTETGTISRWFYEHGINCEATIEINDCIDFINGGASTTGENRYGADTFSVAEYELRNIITKFSAL